MTQALINSLNIIQDKTSNLSDKMQKTEGLDFGKIFDAKTSKFNNRETQTVSTTEDSNSVKNNDLIQTDTSVQAENSQNPELTQEYGKEETVQNAAAKKDTTEAVQEINENTDNTLAKNTEITEAILAAAAAVNTVKEDLNVSEDVKITQNSNVGEENESEQTELNTLEEMIITQNTTITEEDSTMYNELTTLEDPTAVLMLQSQIQKTVTNNTDNEKTEAENDNAVLKSNTKDLNANTKEIFKQFDTQKNANAVNLAPKENIQPKTSDTKTSKTISEQVVKELNVEVVSSQSSEAESSMSNLMQNQTPQDHTARLMIQGDVKFDTVAESVKDATQVKTSDITPSKIIEQVSKQLDGMVNNSKLNMVLNPGTLGKVNLEIMNSKAGLTAQFTVTTQDAKEMLMKGLDGLKESLLAQGINVDNVSVKLEESNSEYKFDWTEQEGSNGGNKQQSAKKQKDNEKQFEQMMFDLENEDNV